MECGRTNDSASSDGERLAFPDEPFLEARTFVWEKDSQGLFDYENKKLGHDLFRIQGCCRLYYNRVTSKVSFVSMELPRKQSPELQHLFDIYVQLYENTKVFSMEPNPDRDLDSPTAVHPYLVVRSLKSAEGSQKGYELRVGDLIKMGRMEFTVKEFRDANQLHSLEPKGKEKGKDKESTLHISYKSQAEGCCRVCYEVQTESNPYISPCSCKGSCQYIHVPCLKKWISSKMMQQLNKYSTLYDYGKLKCEICNSPYPIKIQHKRREIPMLTIDRPKKPYIMLESTYEDKADVRPTSIYLARVPDVADYRTIRLGRAHSCQIRMMDISVSRSHAFIRFDNKRFLLFDNNSKFGTLVRLRCSIAFGYDLTALQIGRTVITFCLRNKAPAQEAPGPAEPEIDPQHQ